MKNYLSLIKFSHTIFALPFALVGYFLGIHTDSFEFGWKSLGLVLACMVLARSAAMAFNRYLDRDIDLLNPRTATREIPAGVISPNAAIAFVLVCSLLFILTTWFINPLCFYLSPIALAITLGYSYTKRFSGICHFVLGLGLALAPIGAFLAVTGEFHLVPVLYSGAVLFWVGGFDIIYALQDEAFDRENKLFSVPVYLGKEKALMLSKFSHLLSASFMIAASFMVKNLYPQMQLLQWGGLIIFLGLLLNQHRLVKADDLSKINMAFFTTNGIASVVFGLLFILDFYV